MGSRGRKAGFDQRPKTQGVGGRRGGRLPTREKQCCETQEEGVFRLTAGPSSVEKAPASVLLMLSQRLFSGY